MEGESSALLRVGAWGQLVVVALAVVFWSLGLADALFAACLAYFVVTLAGVVGIARHASAVVGPLVYPFVVPGFVPLYYFALRRASASE
ncbi:hypothetical protein [Halogeometricum luteum]|uniref:Uncharacterized protein n=1 Tax=Halogeometricum luteum TaxID=2950537 RepID=A0ABU2FYP5_9EURY|nr:hypothetical protein [Halogeometricum sp. S3BR5-2]MDS0293654.1 hypothetical protein [Halogeometricum sp. S3BR5-2]